MARFLAIEWDRREARVAVAVTRPGSVRIEEAFAVQLDPRTAGEKEVPADIGARLSAALAARQIGRAKTLVAVGRTNIELKLLSLPPAPDDELPELVRFQALREFDSLEADWPLDYVPLGGDAQQGRTVLAAAIPPDLVDQIDATCRSAALKPRRLVLRPCAAASLLRRQLAGARPKVPLLVDLLADEADLTVLVDDDVVFTRTILLPGETEHAQQASALLDEIRRTMAAVQNQLGGEVVEALFLCGDREHHAQLLESIGKEIGVPAYHFDPFLSLELSPQLHRTAPEHPERFAPLLGMLFDEAADSGHAIDFLRPRQAAQPIIRRPSLWLAAAAVVAIVAVLFGVASIRLAGLNAQIAKLERQVDQKGVEAERAGGIESSVAQIEKWMTPDLVWLDELYRLSDQTPDRAQFPPAKEALLTKLVLRSGSSPGVIAMEGRVTSLEVRARIERQLRDEQRSVETKSSQQDDSVKPYQWKFTSTIKVNAKPKSSKQKAEGSKQ